MPQFNVALGSAADGLLSLLAVPKTQTVAGLLLLMVTDGEANGPTLTRVLLVGNTDPKSEFEVVAVEVELLSFTVRDTVGFPKLNKLIVVSGTTGFTTSITVLADDDDDELKSLLVQLPSDKATWLVCSVLDPLYAPSEV